MTVIADRDFVITVMRPRYEGANIRTWIGFKHLMYLAEDAVLSWFRERQLGARHLYHLCGTALEMVDASVHMPALLEIDDEVVAETSATRPGRFSVRLCADRGGASRVVLTGRINTVLVREPNAVPTSRLPDDWTSLVVDDVGDIADTATSDGIRRDLPLSGREARVVLSEVYPDSFHWQWQARYFHCNYSDRVQHSAYIRALEEVVERFLADRGLSIRRMLTERALIPVVSRARVRSLASVHMDETVHTTFVVDDVLKSTAYDGRMDCYVHRGDTLKHVATARILHGYAVSSGADAGKLAVLDEATLTSLTGRRAAEGARS